MGSPTPLPPGDSKEKSKQREKKWGLLGEWRLLWNCYLCMRCIALNSRLPEFHNSCGLLLPRNILIIKEYSFEGFENHSVVVNSVFIAFDKHCEQMSWMGSRFTFWLSRSVKVDFGLLVYFFIAFCAQGHPLHATTNNGNTTYLPEEIL